MAFCIKESEYDENIHVIVSGPHDACTTCSPLPSLAPLASFFEISVPVASMAGASQETIFFKISDDDVARFARSQITRPNGEIRMSARVAKGPEAYNSPWQFHLDPSSVEFVSADSADPSVTDLNPSLIEQMLSSESLTEGTQVYFTHPSRLLQTTMSGLSMCEFPLRWSCGNTSSGGTNYQVGVCEGDCQERYSDGFVEYCLDGFYQQAKDGVDDLISDAEIEFGPREPSTDEQAIEFFYYMSLSPEDKSTYDDARSSELTYDQSLSERSDTENLQDGI